METLKPFSDFFSAIKKDGRISITHIGVFAALLQYRVENGFSNPIKIISHDIMAIAKISSRATFYKCVHDLNEYGYINYVPSCKARHGSSVYFPE